MKGVGFARRRRWLATLTVRRPGWLTDSDGVSRSEYGSAGVRIDRLASRERFFGVQLIIGTDPNRDLDGCSPLNVDALGGRIMQTCLDLPKVYGAVN